MDDTVSDSDYLDEDGNVHPSGPQQQPPSPTPAPAPPFHEELSGTLASVTTSGRGFGDARLNKIVPNLVYQIEERRKSLEATCKRLGEQKDQAERDAADLRVEVARLSGEIATMKAAESARAASSDAEARITKLALGLAGLLLPIAIGLFPDKLGYGCGLLLISVLSAIIGIHPKTLKMFEKGLNK